jgi:hypothetical protein
MNAYKGSRGTVPLILTLALDGGEWLTSRSGCFIPGKEPWYPPNRRLGGRQSRSGHFGEDKDLLKVGVYAVQLFKIHTSDQFCFILFW